MLKMSEHFEPKTFCSKVVHNKYNKHKKRTFFCSLSSVFCFLALSKRFRIKMFKTISTFLSTASSAFEILNAC